MRQAATVIWLAAFGIELRVADVPDFGIECAGAGRDQPGQPIRSSPCSVKSKLGLPGKLRRSNTIARAEEARDRRSGQLAFSYLAEVRETPVDAAANGSPPACRNSAAGHRDQDCIPASRSRSHHAPHTRLFPAACCRPTAHPP